MKAFEESKLVAFVEKLNADYAAGKCPQEFLAITEALYASRYAAWLFNDIFKVFLRYDTNESIRHAINTFAALIYFGSTLAGEAESKAPQVKEPDAEFVRMCVDDYLTRIERGEKGN